MKKIYQLGLVHSVQRSLITNPPKGYCFVKSLSDLELSRNKRILWVVKNRLSYVPIFKKFWEFHKIFRNPVIDRFNAIRKKGFTDEVEKADIIMSGEILPTNKNYFIDLEHVRQLMGWDINLLFKNKYWISDQLAKKNCIVIAWTKAGRDSVVNNIPNSNRFKDRCYYVHNTIPSVNFKRKFENKEDITFLFMGSYSLRYDFNFKGGNIVLEAFSRLVKKYPKTRLIIKSWVPRKLFKKYSKIKQIEFQGISPFNEMDKIFRQCDVFLSPNHNTPAQAFLDCMNYSMPIITTDLWANSEIVKDNYNGLLIPPSKKVPYFVGNNIPNSRSPNFNKAIEIIDEDMVKNLIKKAEILINDYKLRKKLGENGKKEIVSGEFSLKRRNAKYKEIFDKHF